MIARDHLGHFSLGPLNVELLNPWINYLNLVTIPSVCGGGCFQRHISREGFGILMGIFYHVTFNLVKVLSSAPQGHDI